MIGHSTQLRQSVDRSERQEAQAAVPGRPRGSSDRVVACVGLISSIAIGGAMALRARGSMRAVEAAYLDLDHALLESEQARDALSIANEELARANVELRAMQITFGEVLNYANERSNGQMRALIEETGAELAEILAEQLDLTVRVND